MKLIIMIMVRISRLIIIMLVRFLLKLRWEVSVVSFKLVVRLVSGFIYECLGCVVGVVVGVVGVVCVGLVVDGVIDWCCMLEELLLFRCLVFVLLMFSVKLRINVVVIKVKFFIVVFMWKKL